MVRTSRNFGTKPCGISSYVGKILSPRQAVISEFPDAVWRESGVISEEIPGFLAVNQKVLEMSLLLERWRGLGLFGCG